MRRPRLILALALLAPAACADSGGPDITEVTFAPSLGIDLATFTRTASGLYYKDLTVGGGTLVALGQQLSVHYTGQLWSGGQFDSNQPPSTPLMFTHGAGQVIAGFDEGVSGMRIGGRRQVIIPPDLGYGAQATGPIPANAVLVFTIDLVNAQ
jgi:FKBP-type peptidyl-prolyl cis-trans isomerase